MSANRFTFQLLISICNIFIIQSNFDLAENHNILESILFLFINLQYLLRNQRPSVSILNEIPILSTHKFALGEILYLNNCPETRPMFLFKILVDQSPKSSVQFHTLK